MDLTNFQPTFRNLLIQEVVEERTKGGLYIPSTSFTKRNEEGEIVATDFKDSNAKFLVLKRGRLCEEVQEGDIITLTPGLRLSSKGEIDGKKCFVIYEHQVDGYIR